MLMYLFAFLNVKSLFIYSDTTAHPSKPSSIKDQAAPTGRLLIKCLNLICMKI